MLEFLISKTSKHTVTASASVLISRSHIFHQRKMVSKPKIEPSVSCWLRRLPHHFVIMAEVMHILDHALKVVNGKTSNTLNKIVAMKNLGLLGRGP